MGIVFLGELPFEPKVVEGGDEGNPLTEKRGVYPYQASVENLAQAVLGRLKETSEQEVKAMGA